MALEIRLAREQDAPEIAAIYAPFVLHSPVTFETEPPDAAEMARRVRATLTQTPWLVCESADAAILGYAYASTHRVRAAYRWSVDATVYVHADHRRRGIGRILYERLFALLPLQGYCAVFAGITLPNESSTGLHEALGFEPIGVYRNAGYKLGKWHDVGWWQRPLVSPLPDPPPEPIPLPQIRESTPWNAVLQPA